MRTVDAHHIENRLKMCGTYHGVIAYDTVISVLHDAPTVEPQQWIPVTKRLPEPNLLVGNVAKYYLVQNSYGDIYVASYHKSGHDDGDAWWEQIYRFGTGFTDVVAWMPLPEPYERSEDEYN